MKNSFVLDGNILMKKCFVHGNVVDLHSHVIFSKFKRDVAIPQRARRIIKFVKMIDKKKSKEIKRLQDINRKLSKHIVSVR